MRPMRRRRSVGTAPAASTGSSTASGISPNTRTSPRTCSAARPSRQANGCWTWGAGAAIRRSWRHGRQAAGPGESRTGPASRWDWTCRLRCSSSPGAWPGRRARPTPGSSGEMPRRARFAGPRSTWSSATSASCSLVTLGLPSPVSAPRSRPHGRLVFLCWQDDTRNELFSIPVAGLRRPHAAPRAVRQCLVRRSGPDHGTAVGNGLGRRSGRLRQRVGLVGVRCRLT